VSPTITLVADQLYKITVDLWNGGGPWSFITQMSVNGGAWQPIPLAQLSLPQDRRLPMFELAFNKMPNTPVVGGSLPLPGTNNVFQNLLMHNAAIGPLNGRQCMIVNGSSSGVFNYQKFSQGVRLRAFKSFTMMLQINSVTWGKEGVTPSIFGLYNVPSTNITGYPRLSAPPDSWNLPNQTLNFMITASSSQIYPYAKNLWQCDNAAISAYPAGQWFHYAFVWDDDFKGYQVFINGKLIQHAICTVTNLNAMFEQMRIGSDGTDDGANWSGGMAWFRAFDYRLSTDLITRDMNDDWASLL
jgi:hypothetical protein